MGGAISQVGISQSGSWTAGNHALNFWLDDESSRKKILNGDSLLVDAGRWLG
jgi:hypothetical protein